MSSKTFCALALAIAAGSANAKSIRGYAYTPMYAEQGSSDQDDWAYQPAIPYPPPAPVPVYPPANPYPISPVAYSTPQVPVQPIAYGGVPPQPVYPALLVAYAQPAQPVPPLPYVPPPSPPPVAYAVPQPIIPTPVAYQPPQPQPVYNAPQPQVPAVPLPAPLDMIQVEPAPSHAIDEPLYISRPSSPETVFLPKAELLSVSREQGYLIGPPPLPSDQLVYVVDVCSRKLKPVSLGFQCP